MTYPDKSPEATLTLSFPFSRVGLYVLFLKKKLPLIEIERLKFLTFL